MEAPTTQASNWPRVVQLAWVLTDPTGQPISQGCYLIRPRGWRIQPGALRCHGITQQHATDNGFPLSQVLRRFAIDLLQTDTVIGHNVDFDHKIVGAEFHRLGQGNPLSSRQVQCTMKMGATFLHKRIREEGEPYVVGASVNPRPALPSLDRLHRQLFGRSIDGAHDALVDATACMNCFFEMQRLGDTAARRFVSSVD